MQNSHCASCVDSLKVGIANKASSLHFFKGYFSLCQTMMVNLPCLMVSCTNFLRPTCSYTECPLSFLTGSCPTERTTASYSSCLFCFLLTFRFLQRKLFSGRSSLLLPLGLLLFLCGGFLPQPFVLGFSCGTLPDFVFIRNPAGFRLVALTVRFMLPALFLAFSLQYLRAFSQGHK